MLPTFSRDEKLVEGLRGDPPLMSNRQAQTIRPCTTSTARHGTAVQRSMLLKNVFSEMGNCWCIGVRLTTIRKPLHAYSSRLSKISWLMRSSMHSPCLGWTAQRSRGIISASGRFCCTWGDKVDCGVNRWSVSRCDRPAAMVVITAAVC